MKKIIIAAGIIIVIAIVVFVNLSKGEETIEVQVEEVFRADVTQTVTGTGKIYPVTDVNISAKIAGEILEINANEGDSVNAGDVLVRLDSQQYEAAKDRAESQILGARADVKLAKNELNRQEELFEKDLISKSELEVTEAKYERALSQLSQAQASLKEATDALSRTVIKAPMPGVVISKNKEVGEIALGSQFQEDIILVIADLTEMEARVEVNENDIINVSLGDTAGVEIDAFPDTLFTGVVKEISHSAKTKGAGTIEEVTNYEVKILLLDKLPSFRPGMSTVADIATETKVNVLNIPIQSLTAREREKLEKLQKVESTPSQREHEEAKKSSKKEKKDEEEDLIEVVFVVDDGVAKMTPVKVGISDDNYYEVKDGLQEGQKVVTGPFRTLSRTLEDGDRVTIKEEKQKI